MTGQDVVLDLLRYVGVTGFSAIGNDQALNRPGLDNDDIRRAIESINSALQTIQRWGPQNMKFGYRSAFFYAPVQVTLLSINQADKTATLNADPPPWILGCSIRMAGDNDVNRIDTVNGRALGFLRGYTGVNSSNVLCTIYSDCSAISADVQSILEPVFRSRNRRMYPAQSLDEFYRHWRHWWGWAGWWGMLASSDIVGDEDALLSSPIIQQERRFMYYVERQRPGTVLLRIAPRPGNVLNVTFQAKLRAERVDASIINQSGGDPNYQFTSLHADEVESILLPIARWRFFSHPALKNKEARSTVKAEYDETMLMLKSGTTLESEVKDNSVSYI